MNEGDSPSGSHVEALSDTVINVGQWVARQRFLYRRRQLDAEYVRRLEAMPGWSWAGSGVRNDDFGEPLDLGGHPHGTAKGIAAGCPCATCIRKRRADDRTRLAERRRVTDPVPAGPALRHLDTLFRAGVKATVVAGASRVPFGVIKQILDGQETIARSHAAALLATSVDACLRGLKMGSRGRLVHADNETIDAAPTWEIINGLIARGFGVGWIGRELGYANGFQFGKDVISRRNARAVADLAERVGDLTAPDLWPVPPLADLLTSGARKAGR